MRPVNNMIEFKQIIGRGTRLFDDKNYFTIFDYEGAYKHFLDPEWDGEPMEPEPSSPATPKDPIIVDKGPLTPEDEENQELEKKLKQLKKSVKSFLKFSSSSISLA